MLAEAADMKLMMAETKTSSLALTAEAAEMKLIIAGDNEQVVRHWRQREVAETKLINPDWLAKVVEATNLIVAETNSLALVTEATKTNLMMADWRCHYGT